jgi:hypothetical protein
MSNHDEVVKDPVFVSSDRAVACHNCGRPSKGYFEGVRTVYSCESESCKAHTRGAAIRHTRRMVVTPTT